MDIDLFCYQSDRANYQLRRSEKVNKFSIEITFYCPVVPCDANVCIWTSVIDNCAWLGLWSVKTNFAVIGNCRAAANHKYFQKKMFRLWFVHRVKVKRHFLFAPKIDNEAVIWCTKLLNELFVGISPWLWPTGQILVTLLKIERKHFRKYICYYLNWFVDWLKFTQTKEEHIKNGNEIIGGRR